jgi:hypothetical protein
MREEDQRAKERLQQAQAEEDARRKTISEEIKKEDDMRFNHNKEMQVHE